MAAIAEPSWMTDGIRPTAVMGGVYLTDWHRAEFMRQFLAHADIGAVVNCTREIGCDYGPNVRSIKLNLEDHQDSLFPSFVDAFHFVRTERAKGIRVLVHCQAGVSRSPAFCCFLLMKTHEISFDSAEKRLLVIHPRTNINEHYRWQLQCYSEENELPDE